VLTSKEAVRIIDQVGEVFKPLPHLPKWLVGILVTILPFFAGLVGLFGVVDTVALLPYLAKVDLMQNEYRKQGLIIDWTSPYFIMLVLSTLIIGVLYLVSVRHLFKRHSVGWVYVFWGNVVGVIQLILGVVVEGKGLISTLLMILVGFYVLFEMRPRFSNK